ncbi:MAG: hypothetical protein K2N05_10965 [Muribaculaceae bacterium]|nr:hypothetical protein [Muribaculaceae bacterium]
MDSRLSSAQRDMDLNPDSIRRSLESFDKKDFDKYNLALYYLLHTQALDKSNLLSGESFEIDKALLYFKNNNYTKEEMMSEFYKGRCAFYNSDYKIAMKHLLNSYDISCKIGDPYWIAKTAEGIADVHSFSNSFSEAWKYEEIAINNYLKSHKIDNYLYALADHGLSLFAGGNKEQGILLCDSVRNIAIKEKDNFLNIYVSQYLLTSYIEQKEYNKANLILNELIEKELYQPSSVDLSCAALLYSQKDEFEKSKEYITAAKELASSSKDSLYYYYSSWQIADKKNNNKLRSQYLDSILSLQDRIITQLLRQPAIKATENYFHEKADEESYKANKRLILIFVSFSIFIFIIISLILLYKYRIKRKEAKLLEVSLNYEILKKKDQALSNHIVEILGSRYEFINMLSSTIIDPEINDLNRKLAFQQAEKEIKSWATPKKIKQIEKTIDKYMDNACMKFREQCSFVKEENFILVFYLWAGFSPKTISYLFSLNLKTIYTTRSRIIKKIECSDLPDKEIFLKLFR